MAFAIYGETSGYVHLVSADTREEVVNLFIADLVEVNVELCEVYNVFAVKDNQEDKSLEDEIENLIKEVQLVV